MASTQHVLLSPAELAFLYESLAQSPPVRSDGRTAAQFRPLRAETGMLPGTNGSARVCFSDGTEAIVGVKAEVEKTKRRRGGKEEEEEEEEEKEEEEEAEVDDDSGQGDASWIEVSVEIPGVRDDDASAVFLAALLGESLLVDGYLTGGPSPALRINRRFHWKLYLDVLLISPPLSYPLPLLSLTTHLALRATRLPRLTSEGDEDPFFDDDWEASTYLWAPTEKKRAKSTETKPTEGPPITLLVMAVGTNILFDPTAEELAVAHAVLAVSVGAAATATASPRLLSIRTVDPPSRLTAPGTPYQQQQQQQQQPQTEPKLPSTPIRGGTQPSKAAGGGDSNNAPATSATAAPRIQETEPVYGVWRAPRGGAKVALLAAMTRQVLEKGGVADEVFEGLANVEIV